MTDPLAARLIATAVLCLGLIAACADPHEPAIIFANAPEQALIWPSPAKPETR